MGGRRNTMAVTHEDLLPRRRSTELGSKMGTSLMLLTILCGLCCFVLCLIAESTRSEVILLEGGNNGKDGERRCSYSSSGKTPLLCAASAFLGMAVTMVVQHLYVLIAVSKSPPPALIAWDPTFSPSKSLTFQAALFFVSTWISFAVGEILLLVGLSVESGHLNNWSTPKESCLIIKEGLFSAAGIFALAAVFLATGLYITAVRAQRMFEEQESVRREVLESYDIIHASSPRSPPLQPMPPIAREDPVIRQNYPYQEFPFLLLLPSPSTFGKISR